LSLAEDFQTTVEENHTLNGPRFLAQAKAKATSCGWKYFAECGTTGAECSAISVGSRELL